MEFIPGNDSIPSFFISKSQETNLNWMIYLDWLVRVHPDYPQIAEMATPKAFPDGGHQKFNDPFVKAQLRNPAFAYYPVTGVSWEQVQDYLSWKTDRLNESILVRLRYQRLLTDQISYDMYNYEAYMAGQYYGATRHMEPAPGWENGFSPSVSPDYFDQTLGKVFPFLMPGYRLPTEEEWEYATKEEFQNKTVGSGGSYPYGNEFFLVDYLYKKYRWMYRDQPGKKHFIFTNYIEKAGTDEPADLNRMKGGTTYDNQVYGVYNMGNNVKEWLMDEYASQVKHYPDAASVYSKNAFSLAADSMIRDQDGYLREKDSLGRMYYRTMGVTSEGKDFRVMRYHYRVMETYKAYVPNPDSLKVKLDQIKEIRAMQAGYAKHNGYGYYSPYRYHIHKRGDKWVNLNYYTEGTKDTNGKIKPWLYLDTNAILNNRYHVKERMFITTKHWKYVAVDSSQARNRVVKSGTYKNPSTTARESMEETDASPEVGFRTVLPYMGTPIDKKNKVKWK
jgi:formylglycine-generating enzyme required for sulfatase activity